MALDDRDRTFEKALARHLRYVAPSSDETGSLASSALPCPDPEILAAYHDGSLAPGERALWKQHVLGCERCQSVLEHLATPLEVPVDLQPDEVQSPAHVVAAKEAVPAPAAAPVAISRQAARRTYFSWLAPTGAVAAGLLAYAVLRPAKPIQGPQPAAVEVAENRQPQTPQQEPRAMKTAPSVPRSASNAKDKNAFVVGGAAPATRSTDDNGLREKVELAKKAPQLSQPVPSAGLLYDAGKLDRDAKPGTSAAQAEEKQRRLKEQVDALDADLRKQGLAQQAPAPPPPSAGQAGYLAENSVSSSLSTKAAGTPPAPPPPSPAKTTETKPARGDAVSPAAAAPAAAPSNVRSPADAISASTESVEVSSQLQSTGRMRTALMQNPRVFASPGARILWRVGNAGSIERSTNKGKDWTPQVSGVLTDLFAGSAPSVNVSWIVGSGGTILLTTDGGEHWTKINSPAPGEIAGIRATDALHAYIWFAPDPRSGLALSFETSDGGSTWIAEPTR